MSKKLSLFLFLIFLLSKNLFASDDFDLKSENFTHAFVKTIKNNVTSEDTLSSSFGPEHIIEINKTFHSGSFAQSIWQVKISAENIQCSYVLKQCNLEVFCQEKKALESLRDFVCTHNASTSCQSSLPSFAKYLGALSLNDVPLSHDETERSKDSHFLILKKAQGIPAYRFVTEIALYDFENSKEINDHLWPAYVLGRSVASFHLCYLSPDESLYSKTHGDLHLSNVFINKVSDKDYKVTFIDYSTLTDSQEKLKCIFNDLMKLFDFSFSQIKEIVEEKAKKRFFEDLHSKTNSYFLTNDQTKDQVLYTEKHVTQLSQCFKKIAEGYNKALEDNNHSLRIAFKNGYVSRKS